MQQLVAELRQKNAVRREAAIARLRVLGHRALARLSTVATEDDDPAARASALKVLDGLDDPKVPSLALRAMSDADVDVRVAAIAVLRPWLVREEGTGIMDALVAAALDRDQPSAVRLAALDALAQLPRDIVQPEYLREVRKVNGQLMNVELETLGTAVKDPWKELQKKK